MLQCTAVTGLPETDTAAVLMAMRGGPEDPAEACVDGYVLCELGEHDDRMEHVAQIWYAQPPAAHDLWLFWTGTGTHRMYRLAELPRCPALLREIPTDVVRSCQLFDHHPAPHSWDVRDPLKDALLRQDLEDIRRAYETPDHRDDDA